MQNHEEIAKLKSKYDIYGISNKPYSTRNDKLISLMTEILSEIKELKILIEVQKDNEVCKAVKK